LSQLSSAALQLASIISMHTSRKRSQIIPKELAKPSCKRWQSLNIAWTAIGRRYWTMDKDEMVSLAAQEFMVRDGPTLAHTKPNLHPGEAPLLAELRSPFCFGCIRRFTCLKMSRNKDTDRQKLRCIADQNGAAVTSNNALGWTILYVLHDLRRRKSGNSPQTNE